MMEAIIVKTSQRLFSSNINDLTNPVHGWYSHPDGNSRECMFLLDNRSFNDRVQKGEIKIISR